ncbi:MAG: N-acylneuraminate cytidylyltransferase [Alphaproteobacteria bacterium MarineAlpha2_Bin1]|nr:MAG: N-acylneuraminate cytidylyltransferase [Alphaproteobacteria bacterium MarineAlpha2_Bin1]
MHYTGKNLGIITARGESKRLKNKNIYPCAGMPLIYWTARSALLSKLDIVMLSTDDEKIAKTGQKLGLEVPFLRPKELARDNSKTLPVIQNALDHYLEKDININSITLLQPTSPLRREKHIDESLNLFNQNKDCTVVSVSKLPTKFYPNKLYRIDSKGEAKNIEDNNPQAIVVRNGPAILINSTKTILSGKLYSEKILTYEMAYWESIDIDTIEDLLIAEVLIKHYGYNE